MADAHSVLFPRFSAARVATVLKDTPVVMVRLGVVFYDGDNVVPFGNHLFAAPISCLWG